MNYAIVKIQGKQYKVAEGDEVLVNHLGSKKPEVAVLMQVKDGKVTLGMPYVESAKPKVKVVEEKVLGKKVSVMKFKSKSRYRRKTGFRPQYTKLLIEKI